MVDCKNEVMDTTSGSTCGEYPNTLPNSKIVRHLLPAARPSNSLSSEISHFNAYFVSLMGMNVYCEWLVPPWNFLWLFCSTPLSIAIPIFAVLS